MAAVTLAHHGGVLGRVHAGEVEHGHVRLPIVVHGEVQRGQLVVGAEVGGLAGVAQQGFLVDVVAAQQILRIHVILFTQQRAGGEGGKGNPEFVLPSNFRLYGVGPGDMVLNQYHDYYKPLA